MVQQPWEPKNESDIVSTVFFDFSKHSVKKLGTIFKKYEDDQAEELTESMLYQWKLFNKLAQYMPTEKLKNAFGNAADEYILERDNKGMEKNRKIPKILWIWSRFWMRYDVDGKH